MDLQKTPDSPRERSKIGQIFYPTFLIIIGAIYGLLGLSWVTTTTVSREAGVAWLGPLFTGNVVGIMFLVAMLAAFVAAYLILRHHHYPHVITACTTICLLVPLLLALIFAVSSFGFLIAPSMLPITYGKGWVTATSYGGFFVLNVWAYLIDSALPKSKR